MDKDITFMPVMHFLLEGKQGLRAVKLYIMAESQTAREDAEKAKKEISKALEARTLLMGLQECYKEKIQEAAMGLVGTGQEKTS